MLELVEAFFTSLPRSGLAIYNKTALQYELGYWMSLASLYAGRCNPSVQCPRCFPPLRPCPRMRSNLLVTNGTQYFAAELRCPRQGRHPETMSDHWLQAIDPPNNLSAATALTPVGPGLDAGVCPLSAFEGR